MRRLGRWLLNALTALSLLLCVATIVLWCRGPYTIDYLIAPRVSVLASDGALLMKPTLRTARSPRWATGTDELRFDDLSLSRCLTLSGSARLVTFLGFGYAPNVRLPIDGWAPIPWIMRVPDWAIVVVLALLPAAWSTRTVRGLAVRRRRLAVGACHVCRYDLTGNVSGVCPECGAAMRST